MILNIFFFLQGKAIAAENIRNFTFLSFYLVIFR